MRFLVGLLTAAWLSCCIVPAMADLKKENMDCGRASDVDRVIAACTHLIDTPGMPLQNKFSAHYNMSTARIRKGDINGAILEYPTLDRDELPR